jgi:hypothetical protein
MNRKTIFAVAVLLVLLVGLGIWSNGPHRVSAVAPGKSMLTRAVGFYDSTNYAEWGGEVLSGNSATGAQTILIGTNNVLPDGRFFQPLLPANGVFAPILIDPQSGTVGETVTPTAVSQVIPCPPQAPTNQFCYNVTATFAQLHGPSLNLSQVVSGDQGIQEAINDASLNGGGKVQWVIDPGLVTLNTGGATTNAGSVNIPARSVVLSASAKVTTTIATCAGGWSLGFVGGTGTDFTAANATLTAGTTTDSSTIAVPKVTSAAALPTIFCTTSNASAGIVHPHYEGYKVVAPAN